MLCSLNTNVSIDRFGFDFNYVNLRVSAIKKMEKLRNLRASRLTSLSRESLYRMLSKRGNPEIKSLHVVLQAMGLRLAIEAEEHECSVA